MEPFRLCPIGVIRTPFADRASAPRQPGVQEGGVQGTVELYPGHNYHHALEDLETWSHVWLIFWFHLNPSWQPKVRPPRSQEKRGLFATRSPHRPNPIGLSAVRLLEVSGHGLTVQGVDMVDGSPLLDIKPYVPYADRLDASSGWLDPDRADASITHDPGPIYVVSWSAAAEIELCWLEQRSDLAFRDPIAARLRTGPGHYYRRIWQEDGTWVLAYRSWRVRFRCQGLQIEILNLASGYDPVDLRDGPRSPPTWPEDSMELHRAFVAHFDASR